MSASSPAELESGLIYRKMKKHIECYKPEEGSNNNDESITSANFFSFRENFSDYLCFCCRDRLKRGSQEKKNNFKHNQIPLSFGKVLVIGLNDSGKTTLLQRMTLLAKLEKPFRAQIPKPDSTKGFHITQVMWNNVTMEMWEVGGSEAIRKHWSRYLSASRGVIYVIDSKDRGMLQIAIDELTNFIKAVDRNVPLLILVNKCSPDELGYTPAGSTAEKVQDSLNDIRQLPYNLNIVCVSALPEGTENEGISSAYSRELCRALDWLAKGMF